MNASNIRFEALRHYSTLFIVLIWIKRLWRIGLMLAFIALAAWLALAILNYAETVDVSPENANRTETYSYTFNSSGKSYDIGWVIWALFGAWLGPLLVLWMFQGYLWEQFAKRNGFRIEPVITVWKDVIRIPSFRGKLLTLAPAPITGTLGQNKFWLFPRMYKEGGILRWRERQMDTVLALRVNAQLPNIIINATANERARRSNLSGRLADNWKFQFEGTHGRHYDVYAEPKDRVVAFQLFTPDVLDVLYTRLPDTDIELLGDKIWFIQRYAKLNEDRTRELFLAVEAIEDELQKQIRSARLNQA